ncbi:MAG: hypothetical protein ABI923_10975, partial [bacterium]
MNQRRSLTKTLALLCAMPLFSVLSFAQANSASPSPTQSPTPAVSPNPSSGSLVVSPKKGSRKVVPPEKAEPLKIPLFAKPPVIDGNLDDEAWTSAA